MKTVKILIPVFLFAVTGVFSQTQNINNKSYGTADADKATIALSDIYNFSGEQALAVKQIEIAKFQNLADIASLKVSDLTRFVQKRITTFNLADSEIRDVLDDRQRILFDKNTTAKAQKMNATVASWQKQKISEAVINQKLAAIEEW